MFQYLLIEWLVIINELNFKDFKVSVSGNRMARNYS